MFELPIEDVIVQFAAVITAALAVQLLFDRTRIPGIIGLLVLGMLLGPGGAGVLAREPVIELLGTIGLLYIMFMAGVEIDLDIVRSHKRESAGFGLLVFTLTFVPATGLALVTGLGIPGALLIGAALSSRTLVSYPRVHDLGLAGHQPIVAATGGSPAHRHCRVDCAGHRDPGIRGQGRRTGLGDAPRVSRIAGRGIVARNTSNRPQTDHWRPKRWRRSSS